MGDNTFVLAADGWAGESSLVRECFIALVGGEPEHRVALPLICPTI